MVVRVLAESGPGLIEAGPIDINAGYLSTNHYGMN
jgi:hypothetical protein